LVGAVAWVVVLSLSGFRFLDIEGPFPHDLLGNSALFVMPIALVGLFAGLFAGMMPPRGSKAPPSLAPEKHIGLRLVVFSALGIVVLLCCCIATIAVTGNLPVTSQDDSRGALRELLENADRRQIKVEQIRVYPRHTFSEDICFCQTEDSAGVLALMTETWRLSPMDKSDRIVARFWGELPWALRRSCDPDRIEYFANWGGDRGVDPRYFVMRDKARGLLVVWYQFCW
jgi:hypothetical protein